MSHDTNPEVQLRNQSIFKVLPTGAIIYPKSILIKDIGRTWLKENKLQRNKIKSRFINY
jgi:hypothetical protein